MVAAKTVTEAMVYELIQAITPGDYTNVRYVKIPFKSIKDARYYFAKHWQLFKGDWRIGHSTAKHYEVSSTVLHGGKGYRGAR